MRLLVGCFLILTLGGCATSSKPIAGPKATIDDSFDVSSATKAEIYYVKSIDGKNVHNALLETNMASFNKGTRIKARGVSRDVPVKTMKIRIVGQVHHGAPLWYMLNAGDNHQVEGEIDFTPEEGERYIVRGTLSKDRSIVWIENSKGSKVSNVIEKKSDSYVAGQEPIKIEPAKPVTQREILLSFKGGESLALVEEKLGKPDSTIFEKGNYFKERPETVTYLYEKIGSIQFISVKQIPKTVDRVFPKATSEDDKNTVISNLSTDGATLQSVAKSYHAQNNLKLETLDLIAQKIWEMRSSKDSYDIDATSWLCKVLANSKNARYREFLSELIKTSKSKKIQQYAGYALKSLTADTVDQFKPL